MKMHDGVCIWYARGTDQFLYMIAEMSAEPLTFGVSIALNPVRRELSLLLGPIRLTMKFDWVKGALA